MGKQPYRSQTVTFDPKVGFILDPVTTHDAGTYRCKGIDTGDKYNSSYLVYGTNFQLLGTEFMKFTLDVNTGHLLVTTANNTIIVKEGNEAVLPCKAKDPNTTVKLYRESLYGFELMTMGRIHDHFESLHDDDDDNDDNEYGDIDNGNDSSEDEHRISKDDKKGFVISAVQHSDENTYKCEAKKQNQQEVMYFYMHVDETHILRGTMERYITVYKGEELVLPCKPFNRNVTLNLYHTSAREILVVPRPCPNRTVTYDYNIGFTLTEVTTSDAGSYRCDGSLKKNTESAYFFVHVNDEQLLEPVNDSNIYSSERGNTVVIPCIAKNPAVKLELYRVLTPAIYKLIPQRRMLYGPRAVYNEKKGFTVYYSNHMNPEHLMCVAQLGQKQDTLFFYWHGEGMLFHPSSFHVLADAGDVAVLPCRPTDADIDVKLYIGTSYYKRREIKTGQQPHRNQIVTFDPAVGFTLSPVNHLDSSRYICLAESDTHFHTKNFQLDVREPPRIVKTNLSVNKSLEQSAGRNMTVFCMSEGMPFPTTFWFKDGKLVVIDTSYELSDANQSLIIKMVKPEHGGMYSCLVRNELGNATAKGHVTITVTTPIITRTNLNKGHSVMTHLKENLTLFCESQGKPEPSTVWFKDGKPVIFDGNVKLGERNQSLTIEVVKVEHTGLYCCKISNINGEVQSEGDVTLADMEPVSVIDTNLNLTVNLEAKLGESLVIFCKSQGNPEPRIEWFKDGKPVVLDDRTVKLRHKNQELYIIPVKPEHAGTYRCVVTNELTQTHMEGKVTVKDDSASSASVIITSIVCVFVLLAMVAALIFYIWRCRLIYTLRQYMHLKKPQEDTEEHSDFSDRLEEEYFRSPCAHGGDNDVGNLIVSECLPETSRPTCRFSDDYSNINYVNKSNETGSFRSHASGVRSVEMMSV
jgi:hypothetical protein